MELDIANREFSPAVRRLQALGQNAPFEHGRRQLQMLAGQEVTAKSVDRKAEEIGEDIARRRTTLGQFRVAGGFPNSGRKPHCFPLFISLYVLPKKIYRVRRARLMFGFRQPVKLVGEFLIALRKAERMRSLGLGKEMRVPLNRDDSKHVMTKDGVADLIGLPVELETLKFRGLGQGREGVRNGR